MARKKHQMKMSLLATGDLDGLLAAGFVLVFALTLPRVRTVDLVAGEVQNRFDYPELSGEDHLPGGACQSGIRSSACSGFEQGRGCRLSI